MVEDTCGEPTGLLCRWVLDRTGDQATAALVEGLVGRPLRVVLIVLAAIVIVRVGRRTIEQFARRYRDEIRDRLERSRELGVVESAGRAETRRLQRLAAVASAARSGLAIVVGLTASLLVVAEFVDLGPVLAGAGLAGLVVGFGAQSLIADLLAGFSMLVEDAYGVGDWIDVDGRIGEVERVGLRSTSFRDIDGTVWHVPNGRIGKVGNLTQRWARATLEIPLALETDVGHARRVVEEVARELAADPSWADDVISPPEIWGVTAWGADGVQLRLVIPTRPLRNWDVQRQMRERLKLRFEAEGIRMPVPQREIGGRPADPAPLRTTAVPPPPRPEQPPAASQEDEDVTGPISIDPTESGRIPTEYGRVQPRSRDVAG